MHAGGHRFDSDILHTPPPAPPKGEGTIREETASPRRGDREGPQFIDILETKNTRKAIIKRILLWYAKFESNSLKSKKVQ